MKCTYCGGTEFLEGPSGGMSTNVLCANKDCRHWFNHTPTLDRLDDLNRVEPTADQKATAVANQKAESDDATAARFREGREAYKNATEIGATAGASSNPFVDSAGIAMRRSKAYGRYAESHANVDRLVGYIEAMAEEVRDLRGRVAELERID